MRCYFEVMRGPPLLHTKGDDSDAGEQTCSGAAGVGAGVCVCGAAAEHLERSGVIEPARWAKSLNSRRQERVELIGRRGRVEEYNPRRRGAVDPGAMRSPGPCEDHRTEVRVPWDPSSGNISTSQQSKARSCRANRPAERVEDTETSPIEFRRGPQPIH